VWCCVFFANHIVGAASMVTTCKFLGREAFDVLKIDGSIAQNIDFEWF